MGSDASEQVLALLSELAAMNQQDNRLGQAERVAHQHRHEEITQTIKALAEAKTTEWLRQAKVN